jgi:hypothetical protein
MRFIVITTILFISFAFTLPDVRLEYSFKTGDQYEWIQTAKQSITQSIPAMGEIKIDVNSDGAMQFRVMEVKGSTAKIEAQYTRLKVVSKSLMGNINLDSESEDNSEQNKIVKSIVRKPFFFELSKNGKVDNITGTESLSSAISSGEGQPQGGGKQMLEQFVSPASIKASLEMTFLTYPESKIAEGHQWKNSVNLPINFPMVMNNTWNLKKIEGAVATIEGDGELTTTDKEKITTLPNGIKSKADLNGRQALAAKVNSKTGWPSEIKILSEIKGKMILVAGGMIPEDMDVPMEISSESKFTITKK